MFLNQVVFLAILLAALTAAFSRGGRTERIGGVLLVVASVVTPLAQRHLFTQFEAGIALVDGFLLCALAGLALSSNRRWPIYAAAFQVLGVLTHFARIKAGPVHGDTYGHLLVAWSYFVVLALLFGSLIEALPVAQTIRSRSSESAPLTSTPNPNGVISPMTAAANEGDHALLARLFALHGLGPASADTATQLLQRTGSYSDAVATPVTRLRAWGFDRRVEEALNLARHSTRTALKRKLETRPCLAERQHVVDYLHAEMAHLDVEQFRVLYLNSRHRLIHEAIHGEGSVTAAPVFPREIVKRAIEVGAVELILAHNHPSGDPTPSRSDIQTTKAIIDASRSIDVNIVDHIVIGSLGHMSMRATGLI
jgi:DNA repair protein RadC